MDDRAAHADSSDAENGRHLGSRFTKIFNVPQRYSWGLVSSTDSLEAHYEHLAHLPFIIIDSKKYLSSMVADFGIRSSNPQRLRNGTTPVLSGPLACVTTTV